MAERDVVGVHRIPVEVAVDVAHPQGDMGVEPLIRRRGAELPDPVDIGWSRRLLPGDEPIRVASEDLECGEAVHEEAVQPV